ncbi:hypothetical protein C8J56DRAFT_937444 [Mycena floridula]|nr:hypothetical protein C8J56DRAFT_937444 [Mycena floridula]
MQLTNTISVVLLLATAVVSYPHPQQPGLARREASFNELQRRGPTSEQKKARAQQERDRQAKRKEQDRVLKENPDVYHTAGALVQLHRGDEELTRQRLKREGKK